MYSCYQDCRRDGFGGWDLVEVVDLIGTIVGEICVTVGLGVGCFGVRSESFLGTRFLRSRSLIDGGNAV
jgi:hypothetical protein